MMSNTPTFLQIRIAKNLSLEAIAIAAHVSIEDVYYFEAGIRYPQAFLEQVLQALTALTGDRYTRDNVSGMYLMEEESRENGKAENKAQAEHEDA